MTALTITLDISQIVYSGTGVARFTRGLVEQIVSTPTSHHFNFFFSGLNMRPEPELIAKIRGAGHSYTRWYLPPRALSWLWNERSSLIHNFQLSTFNFRLPISDIWISSDWTEPPPKLARKKITVVHDLVFREHPGTVDPLVLETHTKRLAHATKECSLILCDSLSTAQDVTKWYPNYKGKLQTIYPGVADLPPAQDKLPEGVVKNRYFLAVGKLEPRKNLRRLMDAFDLFQKTSPAHAHYHLIIVGPRGWGETLAHKNSRIIFGGQVDDQILANLYTHATALVMPSLYEGFGYPIIEAMRCGCPVATSNSSSLAELVQSGTGLTFDPLDVTEMSQTLKRLVYDLDLRSSLSAHGQTRARDFTWDKYLTQLISSIESL